MTLPRRRVIGGSLLLLLPATLSFSFVSWPLHKPSMTPPSTPATNTITTTTTVRANWVLHSTLADPVVEEEDTVVVEKEPPSPFAPKDAEKLETLFAQLDAMKRKGEEAPKELVLQALWLAFNTRSWARALEIIRMPNVQPDGELYHVGLRTLARGNCQYKRALALLREMDEVGLTPNITSYDVAMQICADSQRTKDVIRLLDKMKIAGIQPQLTSYNIAINSLARQNDWKKAVKLVEFMRKESVIPDVWTYNYAIRACARSGAWQRALVLLEEMVKNGIAPTAACYNGAMHACRVGGQRERAITFLEEMIRKNIPVDTDSFSIIIASCDEPKLAHRALEFFDRMPELGIRPDLVTFGALVTALGRTGDFTPAIKILQEADKYKLTFDASTGVIRLLNYAVSKGGVSPEIASYCMRTLIDAGKITEALSFLDQGLGKYVGNDTPEVKALELLNSYKQKLARATDSAAAATTTTTAATAVYEAPEEGDEDAEFKRIRELCEANDVGGAVAALKDIEKLRSSLSKMVMEYAVLNKDYQAALALLQLPNVRAGRLLYGRALHACAVARAWKEVDGLLRDMGDNGVVPDVSTYYELIEGARLSQSFHKITKYRAMMIDQDLSPNVELCRSLMRFYLLIRKPGLALQVFRDTQDAGYELDSEIYGFAMVALKDVRDWQEAYSLLKQLGDEASDEMYGAVIRAMTRGEQFDQAREVFHSIPKDKRGADSLNAIINTYRREGNTDGMVKVLAEADAGEYPANHYSYSNVMEGLAEAGKHEEALDIFEKIQSPSLIHYNAALSSLIATNQFEKALSLLSSMPATPSLRTLQHAFGAAKGLGFNPSSLATLQSLVAA